MGDDRGRLGRQPLLGPVAQEWVVGKVRETRQRV